MNETATTAYANDIHLKKANTKLVQLPHEAVIRLENTTANKNITGNVKWHPGIALVLAGAVSGGFWGLLSGAVFRNLSLGVMVGLGVALITVIPVSVLIIRAVNEDAVDEAERIPQVEHF
jgi:uncharacterized membrane protein